jgi:hypothetical protein
MLVINVQLPGNKVPSGRYSEGSHTRLGVKMLAARAALNLVSIKTVKTKSRLLRSVTSNWPISGTTGQKQLKVEKLRGGGGEGGLLCPVLG